MISCDFCTIVEACDAMEGCRVVRKACDPTFASGLSKISNLQTGLAEMSKWQNWNIYAVENTKIFEREIRSKILILERSAKLWPENSICWHQQGPRKEGGWNSLLSFIWYSTQHLFSSHRIFSKVFVIQFGIKVQTAEKLLTRKGRSTIWLLPPSRHAISS